MDDFIEFAELLQSISVIFATITIALGVSAWRREHIWVLIRTRRIAQGSESWSALADILIRYGTGTVRIK